MTQYRKFKTAGNLVPNDYQFPPNPGLNDAGNGPCPDCSALLMQIRRPCNRHLESSQGEHHDGTT